MKKLFITFFLVNLFALCQSLYFGQSANSFDRKYYFTKSSISETEKQLVFKNFWESVNKSYFDATFNGNDWTKLREAYYPQIMEAKNKIELRDALNKMLAELKVSHLAVRLEISLRGKILESMFGKNIDYKKNGIVFGTGFSTKRIGNENLVARVAKNSSADENGVKRGWILKEFTTSPSFEKIGDEFAFKESWHATFLDENKLERKVSSQLSWYLLPRAKYEMVARKLDEKTLYLKFSAFDKDISKWMQQQILQNAEAENLVIDLRENYGGYLQELKKSLSLFFPPDTTVGTFIERYSDESQLKVGSENYFKKKIFVLIDGETASAAEIMAQSFKESKRGQIIGQKSSGQVLNSFEKNISNGFKLQIAFRDYKASTE